MKDSRATIGDQLDHTGLNLHAVFDLETLPTEILNELKALYPDLSSYQQILLFAHGGQDLWNNVQPDLTSSKHPIDSYSIEIVKEFCDHQPTISEHKVIYPGRKPLGLQSLGKLAGWHHDSPFKVGINQEWGSWFAYRIAILADSDFETTRKWEAESPCVACSNKPCISACPAQALEGDFLLQRCLDYRKDPDSRCKDRCLARMACPVAQEHRYEAKQIQYHYGISMKMIEELGL